MIRPVTLVTFVAFIGSGLYLYQVKHQAQLVDRHIHKVREAIQAARDRAEVLRAEYALLNDPDRLAALAAQFVPDLKPTQPGQWTTMAEIERRLPPVGEPTAEPSPLEPVAQAQPATTEPTTAEPAHAEHETPAHTETTQVARAEPPRPTAHQTVVAAAPPAATAKAGLRPPAPVSVAARSVPDHSARAAAPGRPSASEPPVQVAAAPAFRSPAPRTARLSSLAPRGLPPVWTPPGVPVVAVAVHPLGGAPPATASEAVARIAHGAPVDPTVPAVASALGMARTMMSVNPVTPAAADTLYPRGSPR